MGTSGTTVRRFLFTFSLLWALVNPLIAQQYNVKTWALEEGLPQANITAMVQDRNGYLWLGTSGGLSKFNGIQFQNFSHQDGLCSNKINDLFVDKKGHLWIATADQGICRFDGTRFENYLSASGVPLHSITGSITGIAQATDGTIWVSTSKGLAYLNNGRFHLLPPKDGLPARSYSSILIDRKGTFWLGTLGAGLYKFNGKTGSHYTLAHGLGNMIVYSLFQSSNGEIWIGHYGGITKFTGKNFISIRPPGDLNLNRAMAFAELPDNRLFIALDGGGLMRLYQGNFMKFDTENGLPSNYLATLITDNEGNLWAGTIGGGLVRYSANGFSFYGVPEGLKNENITAIHQPEKNTLWLGTYGGGIGRFDGEKFTWLNQKNGLASNNVSDIKTDRNGNVWIATNQGLSFYNGKVFKNYTQENGLIYNVVNFCLPEANNQVWVATNGGLSLFDGKSFKNYRIPKSREANYINCIFRDRQNRLWLGTRAGIYQFKNGQFVLKKELQHLNLKDIQGIEQDAYNNLWFTAFNQGLLRYSPDAENNRIQFITDKQGLLTECISGLRIDNIQNLWIGTIKGLARLNLRQYQQQQKIEIQNYGSGEGLRGIEINPNAMAKGPDGYLWFGTVKGLSRFNPYITPVGTCIPKLSLLDIRLFLEDTNWDSLGYEVNPASGLPQKLKLKSHQNYISFDYHAICLTNPEKVTYSHKLEGFDKTWSTPHNLSTTTYSNLSPGNYIFKVKACTTDGTCNPKITEYAFSIVPPFWTKDRIIGILVLAGALLAFGLARWREKNLIRLNTLLETKVEQRTRLLEKENAEKEILLKEVHHRVKNNLQIITSLLNLQTRHVSDPAVLDSIREIKDRIKSISMLHQRLYQREELAALDLSEYVQTLCRSLFASYGVSEDRVRLEFDIPPLNLDIDTALTLGLIVNELVSNTLKYAFPNQRSGTLLIELLRVTETEYTLTLSDDGTGLPDNFEEKMATSFGLQLVSSLIKKLQGKLKFYSEGGTQIRLQFVILPQ